MLDEELDPLIDNVARAMTDAPADAGLARRVSMRIAELPGGPERAAPRERALWPRPWVLLPIAAACVLVVAVLVGRPFQGRHGGAESPTPQTAQVVRPVQGRQGGAESPAPQTGDPEKVALRRPRVQPLAELPATTIAPIQVDRLTVQPIVEMSAIDISPIGIERIEISAMP